MATFLMFGKYSADAVGGISAERTKEASELIKKHGGKMKEAYALLGATDLVLIVDLPDVKAAAKVSITLSRLTGIGFTTSPAIAVADFDELAADV